MVSKKKLGAEAGKQRGHGPEEPIEAEVAGRKAKAVKDAGRKAAPSKKAASGKAAGKATPKKKKANKKSAATKDEVSPRTKKTKQSQAAGAREANFAAGYAATDAAPGAGARDPFEVARETMKGSVPAIMEAMVAKAKRGSCTHAKTLLEMTGAKHMFEDEAETADSGEPWAKLVLERMDEAEQESLSKYPPEVAAEP